jgi:hypothetical protein
VKSDCDTQHPHIYIWKPPPLSSSAVDYASSKQQKRVPKKAHYDHTSLKLKAYERKKCCAVCCVCRREITLCEKSQQFINRSELLVLFIIKKSWQQKQMKLHIFHSLFSPTLALSRCRECMFSVLYNQENVEIKISAISFLFQPAHTHARSSNIMLNNVWCWCFLHVRDFTRFSCVCTF